MTLRRLPVIVLDKLLGPKVAGYCIDGDLVVTEARRCPRWERWLSWRSWSVR